LCIGGCTRLRGGIQAGSRTPRTIIPTPRTKCSQLSGVLMGMTLAMLLVEEQSVESQEQVDHPATEQEKVSAADGAGQRKAADPEQQVHDVVATPRR